MKEKTKALLQIIISFVTFGLCAILEILPIGHQSGTILSIIIVVKMFAIISMGVGSYVFWEALIEEENKDREKDGRSPKDIKEN